MMPHSQQDHIVQRQRPSGEQSKKARLNSIAEATKESPGNSERNCDTLSITDRGPAARSTSAKKHLVQEAQEPPKEQSNITSPQHERI